MEFERVFSEEEETRLINDFPLLRNKRNGCYLYLDNAGAALYSQSQMTSVHNDLTTHLFPNPHTHFGEPVAGQDDVNSRIHEARQLVLRFFNTNSNQYQVIFTSNATSSLKLVAENFAWSQDGIFAYLDECHTSAVGMRQYALKGNSEIKVLSQKNFNDQILDSETKGSKLVVFPAMSNFCGKKFPYEQWTNFCQASGWKVVLDAAALVSTNPLDLSRFSPDFVAISFYKIFGYPTGLGALLVRKESRKSLNKIYFGGGTVEMNLVREPKHVEKSGEENFEDGTMPYLSIISIRFGFSIVNNLGMARISEHTYNLGKYFYERLKDLKYSNGRSVAEIYTSSFESIQTQGGIVNFNLIREDGNLFGFSEFQKIAVHKNLIVRVGCFCNIGACQNYLGLTDKDVSANHAAGHVCGDDMDMVNGRPTGSIRVSFGYYNVQSDADRVLEIIKENFLARDSNQIKTDIKSTTGPTIRGIYIYPVKSCAPMKVNNWPLTSGSLLYDRKFIIMHGTTPLTQKSFPTLCLLKPDINLDLKIVRLTFEGYPPISVEIRDEEVFGGGDNFEICTGKVCGDSIQGIDCGSEVSSWLEDVTGLTGLKLVQLVSRTQKKLQNGSTNKLETFANEGQFLIINESSCAALQVEPPSPDWLVEQFRGNIIVGGAEPFEEETWESLEVSDTGNKFRVFSQCTRCTIIGLDQKTGEKVSNERDPIGALSRRLGQRFKFGVLAYLEETDGIETNRLAAGTELTIVKKRN